MSFFGRDVVQRVPTVVGVSQRLHELLARSSTITCRPGDPTEWKEFLTRARDTRLDHSDHRDIPDVVDKKGQWIAKCGNVCVRAPCMAGLDTELVVRVACVAAATSSLHGTKSVDIIILPSSDRRQFPSEGVLLDRFHVNGGIYLPSEGGKNATLILVRTEEILKVVIHELTHVFMCIDWPKSLRSTIMSVLSIHPRSEFNPEEAVVELHAMAVAVVMATCAMERPMEKAEKMWKAETDYARQISTKIVRTMGAKWLENAHTASYLLIRGSLMSMGIAYALSLDDNMDVRVLTEHMLEHAPDFMKRCKEESVKTPYPAGESLRFTTEVADALGRLPVEYHVVE